MDFAFYWNNSKIPKSFQLQVYIGVTK
ncbi:hypothetical protein DERF_005743 [Dermatophagoides farinae]|uniref:Uncharacterized protein n=1 Tax=Dermatophagoides farinae TaxID=6954 RepID=A0A922L6X2_DERFA|nr:hypothetical protein DERF_005743 [Dermatophagoides farinae]